MRSGESIASKQPYARRARSSLSAAGTLMSWQVGSVVKEVAVISNCFVTA